MKVGVHKVAMAAPNDVSELARLIAQGAIDPAAIVALIGVAAISTALAYVLYFRILATAGATNLLLVTFLIPVSAILLGTLFLGETLLPRHFAGMALIGAGLAAIDGRPWRAIRNTAFHRKELSDRQR